MIGEVEELGSQLEMSSLAKMEHLENREVPNLKPWPEDRIPTRVAERAQRWIDERACVKEGSR